MTTQSIETNEKLPPIIGLEVVGRGIRLRPHQPYELKKVLFKRTLSDKTFQACETGKTYSVPDNYEINESPPMPANQAIGQIIIEESWEHFDKRLSIDANVAASHSVFSIDINAGQAKQLRSEEESFYAIRTSFIPFWTLYLPDVMSFSEKMPFNINIPRTFDHEHRREYERFFECYGTHYIKRAWIGGKAMLTFTIAKSTQMSKQDIRQSINTSYAGLVGGTALNVQESQQKLQYNSECTVLGQGGDQLKLGALSSFDKKHYDEWLNTVKENPQVIALEAAGIWTLIPDQAQADALLQAYKTATTFTPISTIVTVDQNVYFLRGSKYTCYDIDHAKTHKPKKISLLWPELSEGLGFDQVDAALEGTHTQSFVGEALNRKLYFFKGNQYIRFDIASNTVDQGYPKRIAEGWPGVTFEHIDAALNAGPDSIYFFMGKQYIRYNPKKNQADLGYPQFIKARWAGLTFDRIDAAIAWGNGKAYFFRGDEHIRYDMVDYRADPGYPKAIVGSYVEDWKFFD
jgi:hypothetical protein